MTIEYVILFTPASGQRGVTKLASVPEPAYTGSEKIGKLLGFHQFVEC